MAPSIIVKDRLRTKALTLLLLVVFVVFVNFAVVMPSAISHGSSTFSWISYVIVAFLFLLVLMFFQIDVLVTQREAGPALEVRYGPGGFIRQVFTHDRLVNAKAENMSFMEMGGWGYRGSLTILKRAALATRRGDALMVQLDKSKIFIVTVDEPQRFVDALGL